MSEKMGVRIRGGKGNGPIVKLNEFKSGQIGIIHKWGEMEGYIGLIVARTYEGRMVGVGSHHHWTKIIENKGDSENHLVQVLPKGTLLEIIDDYI